MVSVSSSPFTSEMSLINKESLSTMSSRRTTVLAVTAHAQVLNTQAVIDFFTQLKTLTSIAGFNLTLAVYEENTKLQNQLKYKDDQITKVENKMSGRDKKKEWPALSISTTEPRIHNSIKGCKSTAYSVKVNTGTHNLFYLETVNTISVETVDDTINFYMINRLFSLYITLLESPSIVNNIRNPNRKGYIYLVTGIKTGLFYCLSGVK